MSGRQVAALEVYEAALEAGHDVVDARDETEMFYEHAERSAQWGGCGCWYCTAAEADRREP